MGTVLSLLLVCVIAYGCMRLFANRPQVLSEIKNWFSDQKARIDVFKENLATPLVPVGSANFLSSQPDVAPQAIQTNSPTAEIPQSAQSLNPETGSPVTPALAVVAPTEPATIPLPAIPNTAPSRGLQLKLRRAQRSGLMGGIIFTLDARIEPSAEQLALIRKYDLGKTIVYDSEARQRHAAAAAANMGAAAASATPLSGAGAAKSVGSSLWRATKGAARAAAMAFSLRCTIDTLIAGQHIECKDLDELLGAERAIKDACETTKGYLDIALTFDGREEVLEY